MNIKSLWGKVRSQSTDEDKTPTEIVGTRKHIVMHAREEQLGINILGWHGGRPYINARLSRFAGETDIDWNGGKRGQFHVTGRREQAHNLPYLGRIVEKINQYTFGVLPDRDGASEEILSDITRTGESLDKVMGDVNSYITATRWCWMKVDAPSTSDREVTEAQKKDEKIRPYWSVLSPLSIVDWKMDDAGNMLWVLEEWEDYRADDPRVQPTLTLMRTLWEPLKITDYELVKNEKGEESWAMQEEKPMPQMTEVPIFPVGDISALPHFFDDTEGTNRAIMNLGSCNYSNFFRCVYPQLYLPASVLKTIMESFNVSADEAANMILGLNYPIFIAEEDKEPGLLMPDAASIGTIRKEIMELVHEMFGTIGLIHQNQTTSVQSGISKEYDFQDIVGVVRERATMLEDAEKKAIKLSQMYDPSFEAWEPKYNRTVSVGTAKDVIDSIVAGNMIDMPIELKQLALKKWFEHLKSLGNGQIAPEVQEAILAAIGEWEEKEVQIPIDVIPDADVIIDSDDDDKDDDDDE